MVIQALILLMGFAAQGASEHPFTFRMEITPSSPFQGEQVTANFILESPTEKAVEVEVMKFPEFRGFWSENLTLRQGPMRLMALPGPRKKAMALVGSYSLNSIIGMKMPQIEPMRILIKSFGDSAITLNSEGSAPPFSELPPIPRNLKPYPFSGAVGSFSLLVSQTQIPFRQNQPFLIRAELQGDGNFAEINVLPFALTSELSLISQNNTSGAFMGTPKRKLFEWVLSTQEPSLQDWTPNPFLTFNPNSRSYQVLTFPTFHFVALPETALPQNILRLSSIPFFPVETWKTRRDWTSTLWFWIVQLLFFFLVLGRVLVLQLQLFHTRRLQDPFFHRKLKINRANQALKNQNWEEFLSIASRMSRELIASGKGTSFHPSLSLFIEADNQLRFSPSKTLSVSRDTLKLEWESLSKALKSPHPTDDK